MDLSLEEVCRKNEVINSILKSNLPVFLNLNCIQTVCYNNFYNRKIKKCEYKFSRLITLIFFYLELIEINFKKVSSKCVVI